TEFKSGSVALPIADIGDIVNLTSFTQTSGLYPVAKIANPANADFNFNYALTLDRKKDDGTWVGFTAIAIAFNYQATDNTASITMTGSDMKSYSSQKRQGPWKKP